MISLPVFIVIYLQLLCCSQVQTLDYIGCYKDNNTLRALPDRHNDVTSPKLCQQTCEQNSLYTYFGNQYGNECHCGETYSINGKADESSCDFTCSGDRDRKCGAGNRNSVYYVCPRGTFGQKCDQECHCKDRGFCSRNGTCLNGTGCELGWKGDTCSQDINECKESPTYCEQNCVNIPGSFYCACYNDSYRLDASENRTCIDIDECKEKPGVCAHNCLNTEGGYGCTCNQGYKSHNGGKTCVDIDECATNNGFCSHFCNNTIGGFLCWCPENLTLSRDGKTCRDHGLPAWAIAVILVGGVILLALVILAIVYLYRRNRRTSAKPNSETKAKTTKSFRALTDNVQKFARQTVDANRRHSTNGDLAAMINENDVNSKNDAINDVTDPLYENLAGSSGATRMKVSDLPAVVEKIRENPQVLSKEFKKLPERIAEESCSFAEQKDLKSKNKYKNVLPYNSNRVLLSQLGDNQISTYINASPIDGYKKEKKYIASHGPTAATLPDFWRMVWEHNVSVIIMLTKCKESAKMKCEQYWPNSTDEPVTYGNKLQIKLSSTVEWVDHIIRKLVISDDNEKREVTQIQYTAWPDHGVPPYSIPLLAVRDKIRTLVKSNQADNTTNQPLLIHCSAGVGRTGTYIALDNLLEEAEDKGEIDIHNTVLRLRKQRMNCVQTLDQYTFIFKALLEGLVFGKTRIAGDRMREIVERLSETHTLTHTSVLQSEFNMLVEMQPPYTQEQCSDALSPKNISKNRDPKLVPSNDHRVFFLGEVNAAKRYVNAVMIPSHKKSDAYISTQLPLENTVEDFWQLCCDYKCATVVVLSNDQSNDEDKSIIATMLPDSGKSLSFDHLTVETLSKRQQDNGRDGGCKAGIYKVGIRSMAENKKRKESRDVAIYQNTKADSGSLHRVTLITTSIPSDVTKLAHALVDLVKTVKSLTKQPEGSPVLVTCKTGVSLCGPYIAASYCDAMLQFDDVIDVVHVVIDVKNAQPHFITTEEEYELVYKIAAELSNNGRSRDRISSQHLDDRGNENELTTLYENCRART